MGIKIVDAIAIGRSSVEYGRGDTGTRGRGDAEMGKRNHNFSDSLLISI
ncbi:MAG: hypothetical protein F6K47_00890 [Symploca sp. SIO2E6]|nr:hypothetical protein [Symploca sp. SIO2E6]